MVVAVADIICGPIVRRLTSQQLVLWWVSPFYCVGQFDYYLPDDGCHRVELSSENLNVYPVGQRAFIHLLDLELSLPPEQVIEYDLLLGQSLSELKSLAQTAPQVIFSGQKRPSLVWQPQITNMLHGSCRNPHHASDDSLVIGAQKVAQTLNNVRERPALLMLSGDQVYADHVAAPMLNVIHQVIELLGLNEEIFNHNRIKDSHQLYQEQHSYYQREQILPQVSNNKWYQPQGVIPVFTSTSSHNHLITFSEAIAMYLLVWSPTLWSQLTLECEGITAQEQQIYQQELLNIRKFSQGLLQVSQLLAHIPTYMIFDDHDVTDDWNLTAQWEQAAYQDPFSKRIIGNMLMAYWLCQGWGNDPQKFKGDFSTSANAYRDNPDKVNHDAFIGHLYQFQGWQYTLETQPKLIVLDCRTRRWRSESNFNKPSGLMDWEALCELQQELIDQKSIILVSSAPMFGVKVIEAIQRMATILGQPLAVDAENWMAHPGAANTLLNIFRHPKTPHHFVILSGDVHYSFVYEIEIRFRHFSPKIWQITSSGIKNQFPQPAIGILDNVNRWLYGAYSPLNLFTKRRRMKVKGHNVAGIKLQRLHPKSGLGYLELHSDGSPKKIGDLHNDGSFTEFSSRDETNN